MPPHVADRNLLFGILALQMDFITRDALIAAMNAWALEKHRPLGDILIEQKALDPIDRAALDPMIARHLARHGGDPSRSLAALSSVDSAASALRRSIDDPDLLQSLAAIAPSLPFDPHATRAEPPSDMPPTGTRYRKVRDHAKGGLGVVFVARDEELNREVALKEIQERHAFDPDRRARFLMEAEITGGLEHPGIVPVYGLGAYEDGRPFYAMRFIKGDSLREAISSFHADEALRSNPGARLLALQKLLRRFLDVCDAVEYAHSRGVLHRDLKPDNVMVGRYGETLVVDWGLAKSIGRSVEDGFGPLPESTILYRSSSGSAETQPGSVVGTPGYMSPEQAGGRLDLLGPSSDVYSLGATLYALLTGRPPFVGEELHVILRNVERGEFPRPRTVVPWLDPAIEAVTLKAMALRPEDRYPTPKALANDLERWLAEEPVEAWREPWRRRFGRWTRRHRSAAATGAVALVLIAAVGLTSAVLIDAARRREVGQMRRADDERDQAIAQRKEAQRQTAGAYLDRAQMLGESGRLDERMFVTVRALEESTKAGDDDLARVARANLAFDRLRLPGLKLLAPSLPPVAGTPGGYHLATRLDFSLDGRLALLRGPALNQATTWEVASARRVATIDHPSGIEVGAFAPDGRTIAIGGDDGAVRFWAKDGSRVRPIGDPLTHAGAIRQLVWLEGGKALLTQDGSTVRVWSWDGLAAHMKGEPLLHWGGLLAPVSSASGRVATYPYDRTFRVYDTTRLEVVGKSPTINPDAARPASQPIGLDLSPDGERLWILTSTTRAETQARAYKVTDGVQVGEEKTAVSGWQIRLRPNSRSVLFNQDPKIVLKDQESGFETFLDASRVFRAAEFSPDGQHLITGEYRLAVLRDGATGHRRGEPIETPAMISDVYFAPDERSISLETTRGVEIREGDSGSRPVVVLPHKPWTVAYRPDGLEMATRSSEGGDQPNQGTLRRWDGVTGRPIGEPISLGSEGLDQILEYSPTCEFLLAVDATSSGSNVVVIDLKSGQILSTIKDTRVMAVAFSPDGKLFAILDSEGVRLWDPTTARPVSELLRLSETFNQPWTLAFSADGKALAAGRRDEVVVLDIPSGKQRLPGLAHDHPAVVLAFSPDNRTLATGSYGNGAKLWDAATGHLIAELPHQGLCQSVTYSLDGRMLLTGSQDRTVKFWDATSGRPIGDPMQLPGDVTKIRMSPDGRSFVTLVANPGTKTSSAQTWDLTTRRPIGPPLLHPGANRAYDARYSPDGRLLLVAHIPDDPATLWTIPEPIPPSIEPATVRLWVEVLTGRELASGTSLRFLEVGEWRERRDRLDALGGMGVVDGPSGVPGAEAGGAN